MRWLLTIGSADFDEEIDSTWLTISSASSHISNLRRNQCVVGNDDQFLRVGELLGRQYASRNHATFNPLNLNPITNIEWTVHCQHE